MHKLFIYIVSVFLLISCTASEECRENTAVNLIAGIYKVNNSNATAFSVDSIWLKGLAKDSFLLKNKKTVKTMQMPLNPAGFITTFQIKFNNLTDTITVLYSTNNAYFISLACGCIATQQIDEVISSTNFIDSVQIINRDVTNQNAENIRIFHN
jgi:hypothetical protein